MTRQRVNHAHGRSRRSSAARFLFAIIFQCCNSCGFFQAKEGFFCTIRLAAKIDLPPARVFAILARPDSRNVFRSIDVRMRLLLHSEANPVPLPLPRPSERSSLAHNCCVESVVVSDTVMHGEIAVWQVSVPCDGDEAGIS